MNYDYTPYELDGHPSAGPSATVTTSPEFHGVLMPQNFDVAELQRSGRLTITDRPSYPQPDHERIANLEAKVASLESELAKYADSNRTLEDRLRLSERLVEQLKTIVKRR